MFWGSPGVWQHLRRWYAKRAAALGFEGGDTGAVKRDPAFRFVIGAERALPHARAGWGVRPRRIREGASVGEGARTPDRGGSGTGRCWGVSSRLGWPGRGLGRRWTKTTPTGRERFRAAAVAGRVAHGKRAGAKGPRLRRLPGRPFRLPPRCGESGGYNLHAGVVIAASERAGLERLCPPARSGMCFGPRWS